MKIIKLTLNIILFFTLLFAENLFAAVIQQVKNGKVLMTLDGTANVGDQFYGVDETNKKTALLEITTIKDNRAVAKILKGNSKPNDTVVAKGVSSTTNSAATTTTSVTTTRKSVEKNETPVTEEKNYGRASFIRHDRKKLAINLISASDNITTKQQDNNAPTPNTEDVNMTGANFGLNVSMDYPMRSWLYIRGFVGYEMLKVSATSRFLSCDKANIITGSTDCNTNVNYLTLGGLLRINYAMSSFEFWGGLGAGIKQPISKKSTALIVSNIALGNSLIAAVGLDYHLNNKFFIPISFEYHKSFNESDTVTAINHTALTLGFGYLF